VIQKPNHDNVGAVTKTRVLCAMASGLVWLSATATAQTFTTINSFGILTNVTGFNPEG
jgi:hypothetical protein